MAHFEPLVIERFTRGHALRGENGRIMLKEKRGKKRRIYTLRLALCVIITVYLLLLSFFGISVYTFRNMMNSELEQYMSSKLKYVQELVDSSIFGAAEQTAASIISQSSDSSVMELFYSSPIEVYSYVEDAYKSLCTQRVKLFNDSQSVNIYYAKSNMLLSTGSGMAFLDGKGSEKWVRQKSWIEGLLASGNVTSGWTDLHSKENQAFYGDRINVFSYVCSLNRGRLGFLYLDIDERTIQAAFEQALHSQDGIVLLVSSNGQILSHPEESLIYSSLAEEEWFHAILTRESFSDSFQIDESSMVVSSVKSDYLDMYYVYMTETEMYYQPSRLMGKTMVLIFSCFLCAAVIVSILCAYVGAKPVRKLSKKLNFASQHTRDQEGETSDLEQIEIAFNEMRRHNSELNEIILENRSLVRNTVLTNLLIGTREDRESSLSMLRFSELIFEKEWFGVIVLKNTGNMQKNYGESMARVVFAIVSEFGIENHETGNVVIMDLETVCLLINSEQEYAVVEIAEKILEYVRKQISILAVYIDIRIGVGGVYRNLEESCFSFQEACEALKYAEIYPEKRLYRFFEFEQRLDTVPKELIEAVVNSIRKETNGMEQLASLKEYLRKNGSVKAYHSTKKELRDEINRFFLRYKMKINAEQWAQFVAEIDHAENLDNFIDCVKEYMCMLNANEYTNLVYVRKAKEYLRVHMEEATSVEEMASRLNISNAHFSRVFKETCGESYMEYVQRIRMEEAKRLLCETKLPVRVIAENTGYGDNLSYFGKRFKAICGVTPGEYRKNKSEEISKPNFNDERNRI